MPVEKNVVNATSVSCSNFLWIQKSLGAKRGTQWCWRAVKAPAINLLFLCSPNGEGSRPANHLLGRDAIMHCLPEASKPDFWIQRKVWQFTGALQLFEKWREGVVQRKASRDR